MAYMTADGKGPYPNKAGEYCGNYHPRIPPHRGWHESPAQAEERQRRYLAKLRFGRPRPCRMGTTEEMEARGYVGLYLKADQPLLWGSVEVDTPNELKEPPANTQ